MQATCTGNGLEVAQHAVDFFFFSSRRRHTRFDCDWSSDVCSSDLRTIIPTVRSAVSQLDNNLPLFSMKTESEQIERSLFQERLIARLSSFFGALSLDRKSVV